MNVILTVLERFQRRFLRCANFVDRVSREFPELRQLLDDFHLNFSAYVLHLKCKLAEVGACQFFLPT